MLSRKNSASERGGSLLLLTEAWQLDRFLGALKSWVEHDFQVSINRCIQPYLLTLCELCLLFIRGNEARFGREVFVTEDIIEAIEEYSPDPNRNALGRECRQARNTDVT